MPQVDNKDKDELEKKLLALFAFMLKYSQDKKVKELYSRYKINRDLLKNAVNTIYATFIKDNKLNISVRDIHSEINKLEPILKRMGSDLYKQENLLLQYLLYKVFEDSYYKATDIIGKFSSSGNNSKLDDNVVKSSVNSKIGGLTVFNRNLRNKGLFINKLRDNIKKDLIKGVSIEVANDTINEVFNSGATISNILLNNEIARLYNRALIGVYNAMGIQMVEWVSAMEDNTCSECADLNGEVFNIKDAPIPIEDTHVSCKCILVPII